jgi:hypothetical protein
LPDVIGSQGRGNQTQSTQVPTKCGLNDLLPLSRKLAVQLYYLVRITRSTTGLAVFIENFQPKKKRQDESPTCPIECRRVLLNNTKFHVELCRSFHSSLMVYILDAAPLDVIHCKCSDPTFLF